MYGADPNVDTVVQTFDFMNSYDKDIDPITDLGSVDIYDNINELELVMELGMLLVMERILLPQILILLLGDMLLVHL